MIKQHVTKTLLGGAALSLVLATSSLRADDTRAEGDDAMIKADEATMAVEEEAEGAAAIVADALDDDEVAAKLQQDLGLHPELGAYDLDVTEIDGRYTVNGMIDESEHYAILEQMIADVEGVDPDLIDLNIVQN